MAQRLAISQAEQGNASMLQELTKVTSAFTTSSLARENMSGASNQQNENTNKEEAAEVTDHTLITHGHVHNLSCRITCKGDEMSFVSTASPVPHYA
ncbi:hypothetical protein SARC_00823 [Sphaeroforma arctica JP610]|uniref:Uncharacterized protein n=1 Tax=Sphaeroforma arctica JP610 TaxID=667725 RepID=A0A0L0GDW5_9EUKA|nr:hypothetical protein SARC_00823 [Sphaeroforma arctica JP610]KNC87079.1 hypothetical protein SARC_00823 [Sphaeroforma arctica JP610]|eukprot:XP_014160981.1 hypothetical protein SARC_00823 [Sphaeroforma arctica JP610]